MAHAMIISSHSSINDDLPENILLHIFSHLPVKERCIAGRVCKQWRRIISDNSLWRHVDLLQYRLNLPKMWKILRAHFSSCLLSIKIGGHAHGDLLMEEVRGIKHTFRPLALAEIMSCIISIAVGSSMCLRESLWVAMDSSCSIKRNKATISDAMLKDLQKRCPNLHILHLDHCNNDNLSMSSFPVSLTSLSITHSTWQPRWLKENQHLLPHVVSLDLTSTTRIDNFDLMDISQLDSLRKLSVSDCYRIKGTGFEVIAKNMPNLKLLNLSSTGVDELAVHHIARHCKELEDLFLCNCGNITDSCLEEISSGLKKLNVLDISDCSSISLAGIKTLSPLHKLKSLIVLRNKNLTEDELLEVKSAFVVEDISIVI